MIEAWLVILSVISVASVVSLALIFREFLPGYFREKGKNLATHEDIEGIVEQLRKTTQAAEEIRAEISGQSWVKHRLWDVKLRCYSEVIENLGELGAALEAFRMFVKDAGPIRTADQQREFHSALERRNEAVGVAVEKVRRSAAVARLVVKSENRTLLSKIADQWNETLGHDLTVDEADQQAAIVHTAWVEVLEAGRAHLEGPPMIAAVYDSDTVDSH